MAENLVDKMVSTKAGKLVHYWVETMVDQLGNSKVDLKVVPMVDY